MIKNFQKAFKKKLTFYIFYFTKTLILFTFANIYG